MSIEALYVEDPAWLSDGARLLQSLPYVGASIRRHRIAHVCRFDYLGATP